MRAEVCSKCKYYDGENCGSDEEYKTPISLVFQCGIADQIIKGEPNDGES